MIDDMTTTYDIASLLHRGIRYLPAKPALPAPVVTDCDTCNDGCNCEMGTSGCEHWCCWAAKGERANTCPAVPAHREHMHAVKAYREALYAYQQTSHLR